MELFNKNSRTQNAIQISIIGALGNIIVILMGFVYRSIFLNVLSAEYLGINGLFTNILQVLSLAEMGITTAITYRFYAPISKNDIAGVSRLLVFFKKVYRGIAMFILAVGLLLLPGIELLIKDTSEVPQDVNLQIVYILFLLNTISSYFFAYKQILLTADQNAHLVSVFNVIASLLRYIGQLLVLLMSKNYVLTLAIGIVLTILMNYIMSIWITKKYNPVFEINENLSKKEMKEIVQDTKACMLHKVGGTIKTGTDNIILSKMISLTATGICSNYTLIITSIQSVLSQMLGNFTSSIGNAQVKLSKEEQYNTYRNLLFINWWCCVVVVECMFLLIDDFICLWVGKSYILDKFTVFVLCINLFTLTSRIINMSYTSACGLFTKDKIRPLIEAILNIGLSICFVKCFGIAGVFFGTLVSNLLTVGWREPLLLYKYVFEKKVGEYWGLHIKFLFVMCFSCFFNQIMLNLLGWSILSWTGWVLKAFIVFIFSNLFLIIFLFQHKEFKYAKTLLIACLQKLFVRGKER